MTIEPIGYIVLLLGVLCLLHGARLSITVMCLSTLLGAAAGLTLPALGSASIQPSHLLMMFLVLSCLMRPRQAQAALTSLQYPGPGFWFAAYIVFSVLSAFFLPRIFAGATLVYSSARGASGMMSTIASPLGPGSANLTQSVYLLGDLVCFVAICGLARLGYARFIAHALVITAFICLVFAVIDVGTFMAGWPEMLDFIRNANYTMHTAETISGFKRIVGSFPEASAYGSIALAFFSFTLLLWLERFPSRLAGVTTICLLISIALCTSTTAYVASAFVITLFILFSVKRLASGGALKGHAAFLVFTVLIIPAMVIGLMLVPDVWGALKDLTSMTLVDKIDSQSGEERTAWNTMALIAFVETSTFGGGLGTVRTSSFAAALLSNVGLTGTALFLIFLYSLINAVRKSKNIDPEVRTIAFGGLLASITQIVSATISGSSTDIGLLFSITAGLAAGCAMSPVKDPQKTPVRLTNVQVLAWR